MSKNSIRNLFEHFDLGKKEKVGHSELVKLLEVLRAMRRELKPDLLILSKVTGEGGETEGLASELSYPELLSLLAQIFTPQDAKAEHLRRSFAGFDASEKGELEEKEFDEFEARNAEGLEDYRFGGRKGAKEAFFGPGKPGKVSFDEYYLWINEVMKD